MMCRRTVLGFSGTIASGKSVRCAHVLKLAQARAQQNINRFAVYSINADRVGHEVYHPGSPTYDKILKTFGGENILMDPVRSRSERLQQLRARELERQKFGDGVVLHVFDDETLLEGTGIKAADREALRQSWRSNPAEKTNGRNGDKANNIALPASVPSSLEKELAQKPDPAGNRMIDRRKLGSVVFGNNGERLPELNRIVWPALEDATERLVENCSARIQASNAATAALVVLEAALMVESGFIRFCDDLWLTSCDSDEAVRRTIQRDGLSPEDAHARIAAQMPIEKRLAFLKDIQFRGNVHHFDTTNIVVLDEGLKQITVAFDDYWRNVISPLRETKASDKVWDSL